MVGDDGIAVPHIGFAGIEFVGCCGDQNTVGRLTLSADLFCVGQFPAESRRFGINTERVGNMLATEAVNEDPVSGIARAEKNSTTENE
jgi:hypothetical protein